MKRVRILVAVALLAGVVVAGVVVSKPKEAPVPVGVVFTSAAQCAECHGEIAREVAESFHGRAYTDPEVLQLSKNFQDEQCISCHAPAPVFRTGVGERVFERRESRETGVDCISCHLLPDGGVAGMRGLSAPCQPRVEPRLGAAVFCAGCHNQHWTVDEYMASSWAATRTCNDCHMPRSDRPIADGGPVRKGVASHRFPGGHDEATLKSALVLEADARAGTLNVRVTNSGAGHKAPTDSRHKSFNVYVTVVDDEGNVAVDHQELAEYRLYYRDQKIDSTQLFPGETRSHTMALPTDRKGKARVDLVYCQKPPQKLTRDWLVLSSVEVPF